MDKNPDNDFYWNCEYCGKEFETQSEADEHEKKCPNRKLKRCMGCGLHKIKNPDHEIDILSPKIALKIIWVPVKFTRFILCYTVKINKRLAIQET